MPPPHRDRDTAKAIRLSIAKAENINDNTNTSLFLTPYSQSPVGDTYKVTALNRIASGPGSTPQDPLAFKFDAKFSGSPLESEGRALEPESSSSAELDTPDSEIQYRTSIQHRPSFLFVLTSRLLGEVYYLLYDNYEIPSEVAFDPEEPALGRIRADSVAPPHNPVTIKACISRVEKTPAIVSANLFADISCNTPLEKDHISFLRTDCPGLSPENPMAIVLTPQAPLALIADGRYVIKNRAASFFWRLGNNQSERNPIETIYFQHNSLINAKNYRETQVNNYFRSPIIQAFRE